MTHKRTVWRTLLLAGPGFAALAAWLAPFSNVLDLFRHTWPVWALACLLPIPVFLLRWEPRQASWAGMCALLVAWPAMMTALAAPQIATSEDHPGALTFVTHNIHAEGGTDADGIADRLLSASPDFIALQEVWRDGQDVVDRLVADYPYQVDCQGGPTRLLSRQPFVNAGCVNGWRPRWTLPGLRVNPAVWGDVELETGETVRVVAVHLPWPSPLNAQRAQIERLSPVIAGHDPAMTVVLGDFNAAPPAAVMRRMEERWLLTRRTHNLHTWPSWPREVAGIDHVYAGARWQTQGVEVLPATMSDHRPVLVRLSLAPASQ